MPNLRLHYINVNTFINKEFVPILELQRATMGYLTWILIAASIVQIVPCVIEVIKPSKRQPADATAFVLSGTLALVLLPGLCPVYRGAGINQGNYNLHQLIAPCVKVECL
jgi:hypothetical protein